MSKNTYNLLHINKRYKPKIIVGSFTSIAPNCTCIGGGEHSWVVDNKVVSNYPFAEFGWGDYPFNTTQGNIIIGNDVWIGENVTLLGDVTIGDGVIIGYGTVISKNIPPYAVVVGNPPIIKKYRYSKDVIKKLLKIKWWEWEDDVIRERMEDFNDINKFVNKYI